MPIYLYWGDDDFAIAQAVKQLRENFLDPNWAAFNYDKIADTNADAATEALNQAMTPVFGTGKRLVWLEESSLCQQCSETTLAQLQRTLPAIPDTSILLITSSKKPDKRLKSTKFLEKYANIQEFSLIPPWKTEELLDRVKNAAKQQEVKLTPAAAQLLAESVGNQTRQLWNELEKLRLYQGDRAAPLDTETILTLVNANSQNSLQLAQSIRAGDSDRALKLIGDLLSRNEPALRIVATLTGQFRTWAIVNLKLEAGERDEQAIAAAAEIANPKRLYFLRKELQGISGKQLLATLPILLELEWHLKRGAEASSILQSKTIELCQLFNLGNR